jgi:hypothetical protein
VYPGSPLLTGWEDPGPAGTIREKGKENHAWKNRIYISRNYLDESNKYVDNQMFFFFLLEILDSEEA